MLEKFHTDWDVFVAGPSLVYIPPSDPYKKLSVDRVCDTTWQVTIVHFYYNEVVM